MKPSPPVTSTERPRKEEASEGSSFMGSRWLTMRFLGRWDRHQRIACAHRGHGNRSRTGRRGNLAGPGARHGLLLGAHGYEARGARWLRLPRLLVQLPGERYGPNGTWAHPGGGEAWRCSP